MTVMSTVRVTGPRIPGWVGGPGNDSNERRLVQSFGGPLGSWFNGSYRLWLRSYTVGLLVPFRTSRTLTEVTPDS